MAVYAIREISGHSCPLIMDKGKKLKKFQFGDFRYDSYNDDHYVEYYRGRYYYYYYYYYYIGKLQVVETTPKSERTLVSSVGRPKNAFSTPGSRQNFHTEEKPDLPEFQLGCLISRDTLRETLF